MTWFWGVQWTSTSTGWAICVGFGQVGFALWAQLTPPEPEPKPELIGVWPDGTEVVDEDHCPDWLIKEVSTRGGLWDNAPLQKEWPT